MELKSLARAWRSAWSAHSFRFHFVATLGGLAAALTVYPHFLFWVEQRPGAMLPDPLLAALPIRDLSVLIFSLIYSALITGIFTLLPRPKMLLRGMQTYMFMVILRMIVMYLVPLDPPIGMLALKDPFVQAMGTGGQPLTRDLFFSGHAATCCVLYLHAVHPWQRRFLLSATILIVAAVLVHHAHYAIDVIAAPLFTYLAYRIAVALQHEPRGRRSSSQ